MASRLKSSSKTITDLDRGAVKAFRFSNFARGISAWSGRPLLFGLALLAVILWAVTGPLFGYSDTWQLVINTSTTIITFLMVFVIQNTQNRDTAAIQIKLDELIRAMPGAHNAILDLEQLEEEQLQQYLKRYEELAAVAREKLRAGKLDTDSPDVKDSLQR
jgi:low affinity Fe/Cu permease